MMKYDRKYISDEAVERYDDARFALLVEGYAARLGEKYAEENKRLQEDESFELPPELDAKCLKAIDAAIARKKRRQNLEKAKKTVKKLTLVAASFLVVAALSTVVLYNTVEAFRLRVVDYAINVLDVGEGSIVSVKSNEENELSIITPTWLPNGYSEGTRRISEKVSMINYRNDEHIIRYTTNQIGSFALDTEDKINEYAININDFEGVVIEKTDVLILYWFDYSKDIVYGLWSDSESVDVLIQIAESCYK